MSAALVPLRGVDKLAAIARQLVRDTPAPEPCMVTLEVRENQIAIQPPYSEDPVAVLGALLVWTHQLTGITGTWSRSTSDDRAVFISLRGRGPAGVRVQIYSVIPLDFPRGCVTPPADGRESVTPDELYRLALSIRKGQ